MQPIRALTRLAVYLLMVNTASAQGSPPEREMVFDVPLHIETPVSPMVFRADDGKRYLSYHLLLTNFGHSELVFERIDVLDAANGRVVTSYDTLALRRSAILQVALPDAARRETQRHLPSGRTALFQTWVPLDDGAVPRLLQHRFSFAANPAFRVARSQQDTDAMLVLTAGSVRVSPQPAVVIGAPLRGGPWRVGGGAGPASYHNGMGMIIDGRGRLPEQFAVDFQKVDSGGSILPNPFPDNITNSMFYSNRAEVLAVGDGEIVLVRDGLPENTPTPSGFENMPIPLTRETVAGNQIALKLADGVYAQYAHLAPGTIRVRVGQRVRRGDVMANVGNAGNAKNPHLHFELTDMPELNAAQGIPWMLDQFELWGHLGPAGMPDVRIAPVRHRLELLLQDAIVRFP